jgi:hypothetical protein
MSLTCVAATLVSDLEALSPWWLQSLQYLGLQLGVYLAPLAALVNLITFTCSECEISSDLAPSQPQVVNLQTLELSRCSSVSGSVAPRSHGRCRASPWLPGLSVTDWVTPRSYGESVEPQHELLRAVSDVAPLAALVKLRVLYSVAAAELMIWRHWI